MRTDVRKNLESKVLIKRHHDYVVRYNADCDSLNPKSVEEILKEVEKNEQEKAKTTKTPFMSKKLVVEKGSSPGTVRKAQEKYEKAHEKQFTDLIKATRQRMQSKTTNIKRQTRSSVTDKADTANSITSGKHAPSEKVAIRTGICEQSQTEHSGLDFVISEPELSDSDSSKPRTRRSLRLFKDKMSDVDETTESKSKLNKERKSTKQIDGRKFEQKQDKLVKMDMNQESNGKNCTDERNRDKNNDDGKFDCSKCIDKKQPVSPCQIHKNKVHIQVEVHTSPKCSRHLLFKKDNKSEDDLKSSNDTDENESIRASRRTRSSISKIKSDHVTNSNNKELHLNNLSSSTERKRNKKAETHGVLKIQKTSKEAYDVDQNPKCLPDKSKEAIGNTEKVTESIEKSPNKSSARKYRPDLTKSNNERETELTTVKKCLGQDINEHFSKQATRKSASDLTNIGNENETEFTLIKDKYSPRKSASDLTGMNTEREMQFTLETDYLNKDIETESVAKHSCNLYKILKDSPSKSPFKDKYMFSFSSPRNDKVHINKCAEESPTEISPKLNVLFPKTDSPVKFSLRRDIMSPGETSPQKFSSKASILSPGTNSPGKFLSKRDVLSPGANSPSKKSLKADVLSPGVILPSKKSLKANLLSPGANSPSKKSLKADILSPRVISPSKKSFNANLLSPGANSPSKKSFKANLLSPGSTSPSKKSLKADILSPGVNSPSKKSSKTNLLSPGTNSPSKTSLKAHGTNSPSKQLGKAHVLSPGRNSPSKTLANTHKIKSPGTKSPHKILSPRRAGLSCSPLRQHKIVKTGDITWNIVDDSESETDLNDSLINKITKSIDKFESDEDEVIFSDFKKTWPVLSSQSSTRSERYGKTDDSTLESETESNCSFGSDISNVVPETAPIKLQKTDYFVNRRSHSRSKCKEDKCAKLRNKRKHATTGGNQESKRRRIN